MQLAKKRADNLALIDESGAVAALIPLLWCSDSWMQEHAVKALLNLSLLEENKALITNAGAVKSLIYVLKRGTKTSKQNAVRNDKSIRETTKEGFILKEKSWEEMSRLILKQRG
ncbi:hypothetical protein JHK86_025034 [Glycine max]|nr:hypothetical protein JHK86_025034 [Glycine max]